MNEYWKQYAADFNALSDAEIEAECGHYRNEIDDGKHHSEFTAPYIREHWKAFPAIIAHARALKRISELKVGFAQSIGLCYKLRRDCAEACAKLVNLKDQHVSKLVVEKLRIAELERKLAKYEPLVDPDLVSAREVVAKRYPGLAAAYLRSDWDHSPEVQCALAGIKAGKAQVTMIAPNPYAFQLPHFEQSRHVFYQEGMLLRDWFAGKALAVLLTQDADYTHASQIAEAAYELADAMLAARPAGIKVKAQVGGA